MSTLIFTQFAKWMEDDFVVLHNIILFLGVIRFVRKVVLIEIYDEVQDSTKEVGQEMGQCQDNHMDYFLASSVNKKAYNV